MQTPFHFSVVPSHIRFGSGQAETLADAVREIGGSRCLVITTKSGGPRYAAVTAPLGASLVGGFDGAEPHCPEHCVAAAVDSFAGSGADTVVAIGGGSVISLGKILKAEHGARFVALPTTYSGSEMTPIYGRKIGGEKRTKRSTDALPDRVIYDPILTASLPARQTAATGMNSLAHAVEALYPVVPNPIADILAREAIAAHSGALPAAVRDGGDIEARTHALYAAFLGGLLVSMVGVALHHALGHVLGGLFDIDHGDYNSAVLPHVVAYNAGSVPGLDDTIVEHFGGDDPGRALSEFAVAIGAPTSLAALGMPEDGIDLATDTILAKAPRNPRALDRVLIRRLIAAAHEGRPAQCSDFAAG